MTAAVMVIDPLTDIRWNQLVSRHPRASVFHLPGWLEALNRTYGYEPLALTTTAQGSLEDGMVFCRVRNWFSRKLVSLPFSDHCEPLVDRPESLATMLGFLRAEVDGGRYRSAEVRHDVGQPFLALSELPGPERVEGRAVGSGAVLDVGQAFRPAGKYLLHTLDLSHTLAQIFSAFHPSHMQRAIRKAEREGLEYECGRSETLLASFYSLLRLTRRRHGLPPQPLAWFKNLVTCLLDSVTVHVAKAAGRAIAAILTLSFRNTLVYKYGGSDAAFHRLGSMPFLFWRAIEHAKAESIEQLDLGRSDLDQPGLIAFKDHLGATRTPLTYFRWPESKSAAAHTSPLARAARRVMGHLPDSVLDLTGRLLYRHLG